MASAALIRTRSPARLHDSLLQTSCAWRPIGLLPTWTTGGLWPDALRHQNVYVPDSAGCVILPCTTAGSIARLVFIPDGTGGTVSQTGVLNSGRGVPSAVAIPNGPFNDGAVYIGYYNIGSINKIQQPATAPTAPIPVGGLSKGVGVLSLAFMGNDLYMAELGHRPTPQVSWSKAARSPCL